MSPLFGPGRIILLVLGMCALALVMQAFGVGANWAWGLACAVTVLGVLLAQLVGRARARRALTDEILAKRESGEVEERRR